MSREPELCHMTMLLPWRFWKWLLRFYSLYSGKKTRRKVISNQSMNNACHGQHLAYGTDLRQCSETSHLLEEYSLWIAALESGVDLIQSDISIRAFLKMRLCAGREWIVLGMIWYPHVSIPINDPNIADQLSVYLLHSHKLALSIPIFVHS